MHAARRPLRPIIRWRCPPHARLAALLVMVVACGGASSKPTALAKGAEAGAVSVAVRRAECRDLPVVREGVGTATAYYSVTVRAQVDGRLSEVCFVEGEHVEANQLLAVIDPRPYEIARKNALAALTRDRATLRNGQLNATRYQRLRGDKMISEQQLTDQDALVATSQATVLADEAQLLQAELQLDYARVKAPIAGVTGLRLVDPGNVVRAADGNGLLVINQIDPMAVIFTLPQDALLGVRRHMQGAPLQVKALGRDGQTELGRGTLALVDNQINPQSGTIRLKAIINNPEHALWPNQFVKVQLELTRVSGKVVVPEVSIQSLGQDPFVYVVEGEHAKRVPVRVAARAGGFAALDEGPAQGAQVVTEGAAQLKDGSAVQLHAASKPGGAPAP